jgi:hypothetical protein
VTTREAAWTATAPREGLAVPGELIVARNSSQGGRKYPKAVWLEDHEIREEARIFLEEFWPEGTSPVDIEKIADVRAGLDIVPTPGISARTKSTGSCLTT